MTRFLLSLVLACALFSSAQAQTKCTYSLAMFDAFGDGWTGGKVTLLNGAKSLTFTLPAGKADTAEVELSAGETLSLSWSAGSFAQDASFVLYDNLGDTLYASATPLKEGLLYTDTARCYTCRLPRYVRIENVYDTRAKLRWSPGGSGAVQDWLVIYGPAGFELGSPDSDTLLTTTPKATVTGLLKKTAYDAYVIQRCAAASLSRPVGPLRFLTYYSNDAGISAVLTPQSACEVGLSKVSVRISNYGANPLSLIPFRYNVNGQDAGVIQPQDGLYTGVLGKDSSDVIEFDLQYNFDDPIEYEIAAFTQLPGDEDKSNDTLYYYLNNRLQLDYIQQFEKWDGGWVLDSASKEPSWQHGILSKAQLLQAYSGYQAWATHLSGPINAGESSGLFSPCFNFAQATADPAIEFRFFHDLQEEEFSGAWMEYSFDGKNWQRLGEKGQGINWYNTTNTQTGLGDVWAGSTGGWSLSRLILKEMKGKEEVHFRFRTEAFFFEEGEGLAFDDFRIYVPKAKDVAALKVTTLGHDELCGQEKDYVSTTFANLGTDTLSVYAIAYSINGQAPVIEPLNFQLPPEVIATHTSAKAFDSRDGQFSIRAWMLLSGDQYTGNDSAAYSIDHRPLPVPMQEDFEGSEEPPAGWSTGASVSSGHGNTSQVLAEQLASFNTNFETQLPRYGTIGSGDSLYFDYRIVSNDGQTPLQLLSTTRIEVQLSGDCGDNFKTLYTINNILAKIEANIAGVEEAIMLNAQGYIAECTGDNLFIVQEGRLLTPPLHAGALYGITRGVVIDLARQQGIPVLETDLTRYDVFNADECFLTGTGAEIIPVVKVDGRTVGTGKPGPVTADLTGRYHALTAVSGEPILAPKARRRA
ncbi:MAG TPA: aminotransferase class IV [Saprospiraceae bacterium]|nr:aminotransferase class IV [Saprospiraceae bacterium]